MLVCSLAPGALCLAGDDAPAQSLLAESMPADVFKSAGLDKLSVEELAVLEDWLGLSRDGDGVALNPRGQADGDKDARQAGRGAWAGSLFGGSRFERAEPLVLNARLKHDFNGWDAKTRFVLDNGQVWVPRSAGTRSYKRLATPEVRIEEGSFGFFLAVPELDVRVPVKRVK